MDSATVQWHTAEPENTLELSTLLQLHHANFTLWHLEDRARSPVAADAEVAALKRSIDQANQRRNDLVEQVDTHLLHALASAGLPGPDAPLHSETPGLILDRLSILALKRFHTAEEAARKNASTQHRERNHLRLGVLQQQSADLTGCLSALWSEVCSGTRGYRLYRQMKMYNDPELNPEVYAAAARIRRNA